MYSKIMFVVLKAVTDSRAIDFTPMEELDNSSNDSLTQSEVEEKRWYNPKLIIDLEKSDFDSLKGLLEAIKVNKHLFIFFNFCQIYVYIQYKILFYFVLIVFLLIIFQVQLINNVKYNDKIVIILLPTYTCFLILEH